MPTVTTDEMEIEDAGPYLRGGEVKFVLVFGFFNLGILFFGYPWPVTCPCLQGRRASPPSFSSLALFFSDFSRARAQAAGLTPGFLISLDPGSSSRP